MTWPDIGLNVLGIRDRRNSLASLPGRLWADDTVDTLLAEVDRLNVAHTELIVKYSGMCSAVDYLTTRITELENDLANMDRLYATGFPVGQGAALDRALARHRARTEQETP